MLFAYQQNGVYIAAARRDGILLPTLSWAEQLLHHRIIRFSSVQFSFDLKMRRSRFFHIFFYLIQFILFSFKSVEEVWDDEEEEKKWFNKNECLMN